MKKKELIELIREVIYSELPDIISEIKASSYENNEYLKEEDVFDGQSVREHIRSEFRKVNPIQERPKAPKGKKMLVDYRGEKVTSGLGVMDWFKGQVAEGKTRPTGEFKHTDDQMKNFMEQKFGKKIK